MPIMVDTAKLLQLAQRACLTGIRDRDPALQKAGESVMSALVVVLKYPQAELPDALGPHIELITGRKG